MSQTPSSITCPRCGNVSAYSTDECLKCGLPLSSIREVMTRASGTATTPQSSQESKARKGKVSSTLRGTVRGFQQRTEMKIPFSIRHPDSFPWELQDTDFTTAQGVYSVPQNKRIPCITHCGLLCQFIYESRERTSG